MPKVTWGRNISPEINTEAWLKEFNDAIEGRRRKCKPTYEEIAAAACVSRQALAYKMKSGSFTLQEFAGIANFLKFPDDLILHLVRTRCTQ